MSSTKLDQLRAVVADESLPLPERKIAAEHYVSELVDAVPAPADDDAAVLALQTPYTKIDPILGNIYIRAWEIGNEIHGWAASGPTTIQARKHIHQGRQFRVLLTIVADDAHCHLERLEACQRILDELPARNFYRVNSYTAERLLAQVKPANATKWIAGEHGTSREVPVERPPQTFDDLWEI